MSDSGAPESHGVCGGTQREDGAGIEGPDEMEWAEQIETGGDAA